MFRKQHFTVYPTVLLVYIYIFRKQHWNAYPTMLYEYICLESSTGLSILPCYMNIYVQKVALDCLSYHAIWIYMFRKQHWTVYPNMLHGYMFRKQHWTVYPTMLHEYICLESSTGLPILPCYMNICLESSTRMPILPCYMNIYVQKVALDCLSYHATASNDDAISLSREPIPKVKIILEILTFIWVKLFFISRFVFHLIKWKETFSEQNCVEIFVINIEKYSCFVENNNK